MAALTPLAHPLRFMERTRHGETSEICASEADGRVWRAGSVPFDGDGKVILTKNWSDTGWSLAKGHVDGSEMKHRDGLTIMAAPLRRQALVKAAGRELLEEAGVYGEHSELLTDDGVETNSHDYPTRVFFVASKAIAYTNNYERERKAFHVTAARQLVAPELRDIIEIGYEAFVHELQPGIPAQPRYEQLALAL